MDLHDRLFRLKHLAPGELPRLLKRRFSRVGEKLVDRVLYTPRGPRRASPHRDVRRISLFHPSVHTPAFRDSFRNHFPEDADALIQAANAAAVLVVDLFGSPVNLRATRGGAETDGPIPWHTDALSGKTWPATAWSSQIRWGAGGDIRAVWELSRCNHFVMLGQAYALTGDERFSMAFSDQLEDWIRKNPPNYGPNWVSSLEVALRAANWIAAWQFFSESRIVKAALGKQLGGVLWEHGRHILRHLEWAGELSTNHYLGNLLGLSYIGHAIGEVSWSEFARKELVHEIGRQTHPDGFDFEGSTGYHRLVTEIFFYFCLIDGEGAQSLPMVPRREALISRYGKEFIERLRLMFRMSGALAGPHHGTPLVGDNDSARVHSLFRRPDADMGYLSDFGAELLGEDRARVAGSRPASEAAWLFGCDALVSIEAVGVAQARLPNLRPGPSGIVTLRGPRDVAWFLMAPNGTRGVGNHTHNDKLSVLLSVGADDFLVDPGTLAYSGDPAARNSFRATRSHSTVMVDGEEQNRFSPDNLFALSDDAKVTLVDFVEAVRVAASHSGYERLSSPVRHKRSLQRMNDPLGWVIEDELTGDGKHEAVWTFVCGAGIEVHVREDGTAVLTGKEGTLEIRTHLDGLRFTVEDGVLSPAYGTSVRSQLLRASWDGPFPVRATFTAGWWANGSSRGKS